MGFFDLLAFFHGWKSNGTVIGGPYCVVAGQSFVAGQVEGETFVAGEVAGQSFVAGQVAGQGCCAND